MTISEARPTVSPGEPAPDFVLPAVDGTGTVSLADYRGKSPVVPRVVHRAVVPVLPAGHRPDRQRPKRRSRQRAWRRSGSWRRRRRTPGSISSFGRRRLRLAADPELATHRAFGVPKPAPTPELMKALETTRINPDGLLPEPLADHAGRCSHGKARRLCGERNRPCRHAATVAAAQGPVPDRPRRHRALGQHRVRDRGLAGLGNFPRAMKSSLPQGHCRGGSGCALRRYFVAVGRLARVLQAKRSPAPALIQSRVAFR